MSEGQSSPRYATSCHAMSCHGGSCHRQSLVSRSVLPVFEALEPRLLLSTLYWDPDTCAANNCAATGAGLGGAGTWNTTANQWYDPTCGTDVAWNNYPSYNGDTAVFFGTQCGGTAGPVAVSGGMTVGAIEFRTTGYAIQGGGLSNSGCTGGCDWSCDLDVGFSSGGISASISSAITGDESARLRVCSSCGNSTLEVSGANNYGGPTTISGATLRVVNGSLPGGESPPGVENNGTLVFSQTSPWMYYGQISGGGSVVVTGAGELTLSCEYNCYAGGTRVEQGAVLRVTACSLPGDVEVIGTLLFDGGDFGGDISGSGSVEVASCSSVSLSGMITGGISVRVNEGGELTLTCTANSLEGDTENNGTLIFDYESGQWTYCGDISGGGTVTITGGGEVTFTGSNSYTGGTTIDYGILVVGAGALPQHSGGEYLAAGQLTLSITGNLPGIAGILNGLVAKGGDSGAGAAGLGARDFAVDIVVDQATLASLLRPSANKGKLGLTRGASGVMVLERWNAGSSGREHANGAPAVDIVVDPAIFAHMKGALKFREGNVALIKDDSGALVLTTADSALSGEEVGFGLLSLTTGEDVFINSGASLIFDPDSLWEYDGWIGGYGSVAVAGSCTLTLSGENTYGGGTTVCADATLHATTCSLPGDVVVGGTLELSFVGACEYGGTISGGGVVAVYGVDVAESTLCGTTCGKVSLTVSDLTLSGTITGGVSLTVSGEVVLGGTNNYCGGTTVESGGTLRVAETCDLPCNATVCEGGTLVFEGASGGDYGGTISGGGVVKIAGGEATLGGEITGGLSVTVTDGGVLTLTCSNTYTGGTDIENGTLSLGGDGQLPSCTTVRLGDSCYNSGTLKLNGHDQELAGLETCGEGTANRVAGGCSYQTATLTLDLEDGFTFSGILGGESDEDKNLNLVKKGSATLTLSGENNYAGSTAIENGTLSLGEESGQLPCGTVVTLGFGEANGILKLNGHSQELAGLETCGEGTGNRVAGGCSCQTATLTLDLENDFTFGGILGGDSEEDKNLNLVKKGSATLTLSGENNYTGSTEIENGMLSLGCDDALPTDTMVTLGDSGSCTVGVLKLNGHSQELAGLTADGSADNRVVNGTCEAPGTLTLNMDGEFAGTLGWSSCDDNYFSVTKIGSGTLTLNGANTYTGDTFILDGTLSLDGGDDRLPTGTSVTLGDGTNTGVLNLNGHEQTLAGLWAATSCSGNRVVGGDSCQTATLTVHYACTAEEDEFQGVLGGDGADGNMCLTKSGAGTLYLGGQNDYSGATTIAEGALRADDECGLPSTSNLVFDGGVLETCGTFDRGLGDGEDEVQWCGDGGFSAYGWTLTVQISCGADLDWGELYFVQAGKSLLFGSPTANYAVFFQNNIDLSAQERTICVTDNISETGDYAQISSVLSSDTASLKKTGNGLLYLSETNTYKGATTISGGVLYADDGCGLPNDSNLIFNGGVLKTVLADTFDRGLGDGQDEVQWTGDGGFAACYKLTVNIGGCATPNTLEWGNYFVPAASSLLLGLSDYPDYYWVEFVNPIKFGGGDRTIVVNDYDPESGHFAPLLSGQLSCGSLTKAGDGTLKLSCTCNDYSGGTTVTGGTLNVTTDTLPQEGDVVLQDGAVLLFDQSTSCSYQHTISGTGSLALSGGGTLTLTCSQGYEGATLVKNGTLVLGGNNVLPTCTTVTLGDGSNVGILNLNGHEQTLAGLATAENDVGSRVVGGSCATAKLTLDLEDDFTFSGILGGGSNEDKNLDLVKMGSAILTLSGTNDYSGRTYITEGTVELGVDDSLPKTTILELGTGTPCVLKLNGHWQELAGLYTSGSAAESRVINGAEVTPTLTLKVVSGLQSFGGFLGGGDPNANNFNLTKEGGGTQWFFGQGGHTHTGQTDVREGEFEVDGSVPNSKANVDKKGTLTGDGSFNKPVSFGTSCTLQETDCGPCEENSDGQGDTSSVDARCFGLTRVWTSAGQYSPDSGLGEGWSVAQWPRILAGGAEGGYVVTDGASSREWFDWDQVLGCYRPAHGGLATLVDDTNNHEFTLTDTQGNVTKFFDFYEEDESLQGVFKSLIDPSGNRTWVKEYAADGKIEDLRCTLSEDEETIERYENEYGGEGRLRNVILSRSTNGGESWTPVREVVYSYYGDVGVTDTHGNDGDLRTVTIKDGDGVTIETKYYRYYTTAGLGGADKGKGYPGALKFSFEGPSYARLVEGLHEIDPELEPEDASDAQVAPYADLYQQYDIQHRVTLKTTKGGGCSAGCQGRGTQTFDYSTYRDEYPNEYNEYYADGYNHWWYKTVETLTGYDLGPGNENAYPNMTRTTYSNYAGQVMLEILEHVLTGNKWYTFHEYDGNGREVLTAQTSAITGFYESCLDLLNKVGEYYDGLDNYAGLISVTSYYPQTTATQQNPGGVAGYVYKTSLRHGELGTVQAGTEVVQSCYDYIQSPAAGAAVYAVNSITVYHEDNGGDEKTTYDYSWYGSTAQMQSQTTIYPAIDDGSLNENHNGSGSATCTKTYFDTFDRPIWTMDADGFLFYTEYDSQTGAAVKTIADVDTTQEDDFENLPCEGTEDEWTTPAGGGLHLITQYEVDDQGRTTKVADPAENVTYVVYNDAAHETRVYAGWNSSTNKPTVPTVVAREDWAHGYTETLTITAAPHLTNGLPDGTETFALSDVRSISRSFTNLGGQTIEDRTYFSFDDIENYTTEDVDILTAAAESLSTFGVEGTNFLSTTYAYCVRGWVARTQDPTGTIYRTFYHPIGRTVSLWVGTDDTPDSGSWSPTNLAGTNMVKTAEYFYDEATPGSGQSGVGDGNLTSSRIVYYTDIVDEEIVDYYYETLYQYDWRNRLTDARGPDGVATHTDYDNLGNALLVQTYADGNADLTLQSCELRGQVAYSYDELGRVYRTCTYEVDPETGDDSDYLVTNIWYNARGMVMKTADSSGLFQKTAYDGAGRAVASYVSFDTSETCYTEADDVAGDTVIEQTCNTYDDAGHVIRTTSYQRTESTSKEGDLSSCWSSCDSRRTFVDGWFDAVGRTIATVNYGTYGGSTPDRTTDPPTCGSNDYILTAYGYNEADFYTQTTDNKEHVARTYYDLAGRTTRTVANYVNGVVTETETCTDQTTEYLYDSAGRLSILRARNAKGDDELPNNENVDIQDTRYIYTSNFSRSWVTDVLYPDSSADTSETAITITSLTQTGGVATAVTSAAHGYSQGETVQIAGAVDDHYNGWFVVTDVLDNTTFNYVVGTSAGASTTGASTRPMGSDEVHTTYDRLGRKVTVTDQRGVVHTYTYDESGRLAADAVTTLPSGVDGSVRRIEWAYDDLGRVEAVTSFDDPDGGTEHIVNQVAFAYDGWGNVATSWQAHAGEAVTSGESESPHVIYAYDDTDPNPHGAVPYVRLESVTYPDDERVVTYHYDGGNGIDDILSRLSRIADENDTATYAAYTYLGAGTIVQVAHPAVCGVLTLSYGSAGVYDGWDRFGRVLEQTWTVASTVVDGYEYTYDRNSNRLSRTLTADEAPEDFDEIYTYDDLDRLQNTCRDSAAFQSWGLDALGNWAGYIESDGQTTTLDQTRTHDEVNQIGEIAATCGANWVDPAYDAAGNMILAPRPGQESCSCEALLLVYDGWNRLAKAYEDTNGNGEIGEGDTLIAEYQYDGQGRRVTKTVEETTTHYFFNENWQVLETRVGGVEYPLDQYVWDIRYIDAPVVRFHDGNTDGDYDGGTGEGDNTLYYTQDANFNTTALVDATPGSETEGDVVERYMYDPYGKATVLDEEWQPVTNNESAYASEILYAGYRFDPETGMYDARKRPIHPTLGRFLGADPIPYTDGMSLFEYGASNPMRFVDPMGTKYEPPGQLPPADDPIFCFSQNMQGIWDTVKAIAKAIETGVESVLTAAREYIDGPSEPRDQIKQWLKDHKGAQYGLPPQPPGGSMMSNDPRAPRSAPDVRYFPAIEFKRASIGTGIESGRTVYEGDRLSSQGSASGTPPAPPVSPRDAQNRAWATQGPGERPNSVESRGWDYQNGLNRGVAPRVAVKTAGAALRIAHEATQDSRATFVGWVYKEKCYGYYVYRTQPEVGPISEGLNILSNWLGISPSSIGE